MFTFPLLLLSFWLVVYSLNLLASRFQQLTNALLDLEEERAVWFAKEKASVEAIKEKANAYNDEVGLLSSELSKVKFILKICFKLFPTC